MNKQRAQSATPKTDVQVFSSKTPRKRIKHTPNTRPNHPKNHKSSPKTPQKHHGLFKQNYTFGSESARTWSPSKLGTFSLCRFYVLEAAEATLQGQLGTGNRISSVVGKPGSWFCLRMLKVFFFAFLKSLLAS